MPGRDKFTPQPTLSLGRYRHYKGGEYEVLMMACDEATHEWLVVYRPLYDHPEAPKIWARRYEVFVEQVVIEGVAVPRFEKVEG